MIFEKLGIFVVILCAILIKCEDDDLEPMPEANENFEDHEFYNTNWKYYDFKIIVPGGSLECFHQSGMIDDHFYVSFQTLTGQDRNLDFTVRSQLTKQEIYRVDWDEQGHIDFKVNATDTFTFCLDNFRGRFSQKMVMFYMVQFMPNTKNETAANVTDTEKVVWRRLNFVEEKLASMVDYQASSKAVKSLDLALQIENNNYIQWRALFQITIIILTSVCQIVFMRRLFEASSSTTSRQQKMGI